MVKVKTLLLVSALLAMAGSAHAQQTSHDQIVIRPTPTPSIPTPTPTFPGMFVSGMVCPSPPCDSPVTSATDGHHALAVQVTTSGSFSVDALCQVAIDGPISTLYTITTNGSIEWNAPCDTLWVRVTACSVCSDLSVSAWIRSIHL